MARLVGEVEGGQAMKWCGYTDKGAEKMARLLGGKTAYYLLAIASLGLLLGASVKWHG
ncbi:MAG: hypothetical protein PHV11_08330 [Candidatus Bipolaricaulis sp.]|nr:hypothetical protein [Candidatus Bipolaricaulis sp.]